MGLEIGSDYLPVMLVPDLFQSSLVAKTSKNTAPCPEVPVLTSQQHLQSLCLLFK
jgi:hypothetical protein